MSAALSLCIFFMAFSCHAMDMHQQEGSLSIGPDGKVLPASSLMRRGTGSQNHSGQHLLDDESHDSEDEDESQRNLLPQLLETADDDEELLGEDHMMHDGRLEAHRRRISGSLSSYLQQTQGLKKYYYATPLLRARRRRLDTSTSASASGWRRRRREPFFHTTTQSNPWFKMNLGQDESVIGVGIGNRIDCCQDRADNYKVDLCTGTADNTCTNCVSDGGSLSANNLWQYHWCTTEQTARYVKVYLPGDSKTLNMQEVSAYAWMSLTGHAVYQSSTNDESGPASNTIDGDTGSVFTSNTCSSTDETGTTNPEWVDPDVPDEAVISSVKVWGQSLFKVRMNGFQISVDTGTASSPSWTSCGSAQTVSSTTVWPITVLCGAGYKGIDTSSEDNVAGQGIPAGPGGVKIAIPGDNKILTLCEVKISWQLGSTD